MPFVTVEKHDEREREVITFVAILGVSVCYNQTVRKIHTHGSMRVVTFHCDGNGENKEQQQRSKSRLLFALAGESSMESALRVAIGVQRPLGS